MSTQVEGLGEPVLDVTLQPGDVLYVPLGWIHATSTAESDERSCHATLGARLGVLLCIVAVASGSARRRRHVLLRPLLVQRA